MRYFEGILYGDENKVFIYYNTQEKLLWFLTGGSILLGLGIVYTEFVLEDTGIDAPRVKDFITKITPTVADVYFGAAEGWYLCGDFSQALISTGLTQKNWRRFHTGLNLKDKEEVEKYFTKQHVKFQKLYESEIFVKSLPLKEWDELFLELRAGIEQDIKDHDEATQYCDKYGGDSLYYLNRIDTYYLELEKFLTADKVKEENWVNWNSPGTIYPRDENGNRIITSPRKLLLELLMTCRMSILIPQTVKRNSKMMRAANFLGHEENWKVPLDCKKCTEYVEIILRDIDVCADNVKQWQKYRFKLKTMKIRGFDSFYEAYFKRHKQWLEKNPQIVPDTEYIPEAVRKRLSDFRSSLFEADGALHLALFCEHFQDKINRTYFIVWRAAIIHLIYHKHKMDITSEKDQKYLNELRARYPAEIFDDWSEPLDIRYTPLEAYRFWLGMSKPLEEYEKKLEEEKDSFLIQMKTQYTILHELLIRFINESKILDNNLIFSKLLTKDDKKYILEGLATYLWVKMVSVQTFTGSSEALYDQTLDGTNFTLDDFNFTKEEIIHFPYSKNNKIKFSKKSFLQDPFVIIVGKYFLYLQTSNSLEKIFVCSEKEINILKLFFKKVTDEYLMAEVIKGYTTSFRIYDSARFYSDFDKIYFKKTEKDTKEE